ncbi:hypothetical protein [Listeria monocytogenes]|uniref:hypothetical protein n=1 Tax=Listeria monocytogenes TaxID=1639 RepID=UPI000737B633|nr:hypothetical protein [Listeria monocytogenes]EAD2079583.1 hypothetical protein [Listeria monocytogenes]EAH1841805.1 hypothetical protein [Listeria monocytogenes]ECW2836842.1 hypothetical protein [Listeria monocytogenes]EIC0890900.1 hypothetical protein [Listeria monocytogenes]EIE4395219.1 hypothetical protein [Listeria monocytogenes]
MRMFKATIYYGDEESIIRDESDFKKHLEYLFQQSKYGITHFENFDKSYEFEWDDDIDINSTKAGKEVYEKYFDKEVPK